ncbi:YqeB family protein [Virgibacillus salexigens]|uniref:YqeB family protein n=1 Tax=Virgibacillus salexigens TaxID=61016 RepID=UPI0030812F5E
MENTSKIGMGFLEKLIAILFPVVLGTIGWFLPKLLELIKRIPVFSDSKVIELLNSFNPFWVSITLMFVGGVIGILLSLTIYSEALKMSVNNKEIMINKDDKEKRIRKSEVKEIFMEDNTVVITGNKSQELLSEKTDIKRNKIQEIFLYHHYPWSEQDPYVDEFALWTLEDNTFGEKINAILYERRNAIREGDKKKTKNLKTDLNELGIVVKDQNEDQYIRKVQD